MPIRAAFITDEDQFTDSKSKEYNLDALVEDGFNRLSALRLGINTGQTSGRVENMKSMANNQPGIIVCSGKKTFEYQVCEANVSADKDKTKKSWLFELLKRENAIDIGKVDSYMAGLGDGDMSEDEQQNVALLMWKCLPEKAEFAQMLNEFLLEKMEESGTVNFMLPTYIQRAIIHLVP